MPPFLIIKYAMDLTRGTKHGGSYATCLVPESAYFYSKEKTS
jgi:hypothetical protein